MGQHHNTPFTDGKAEAAVMMMTTGISNQAHRALSSSASMCTGAQLLGPALPQVQPLLGAFQSQGCQTRLAGLWPLSKPCEWVPLTFHLEAGRFPIPSFQARSGRGNRVEVRSGT
jgi:hypothetical protein